MRTQILLGLVLTGVAVGGYFETEIRDFASANVSRVTGAVPFGRAPEPVLEPGLDGSPEQPSSLATQNTLSTPNSAGRLPPKEVLSDTLRSIRGAPSDAATEQRSEYLRRLNAETGGAGASPLGMVPPTHPGAVPPPPILPGAPPESPVSSSPSEEEVDSFEMDSEEFEPETDEEVLDDGPVDEAELSPDETSEDGV